MPPARALLAAALVLVATPSAADIPPPPGDKFVDFAYAVDGLERFPDYVLLGYPSSASNGRPLDEYAEVSSQPTKLGRRSGTPVLYAVKRADYEAWKATLPPLDPDGPTRDHPAFVSFFGSDKVVRCDETPERLYQLPESDPRDTVVDRLRVVALGPGSCDLARASSDGASPSAEAGGFATPPDGDPSRPSDASAPAGTPSGSGGCAGCAVSGADHEGLVAGLVTALSLALGLASRRGARGGRR